MTSPPLLSVVMPAHQAAHHLARSLGALVASDLPREQWELIVVDDASRDDTPGVAGRFADRVLSLPGRPGGPGKARNAGAALARGSWLVFIDADVLVHRDALRKFAEAGARNPEVVAIFGVYDTQPHARGLVSVYRNLLHRYVHLRGAGAAETFWAGCGAVRQDLFQAVGGFDVLKYPRPQIEDIELGYRLRDRGGHILLDPDIQATHLKRWTLGGILRTDILDRGIPWTLLLLERSGGPSRSLNVGRAEPIKVACAGGMWAGTLAGILLGKPLLLIVLPAGAALLIVMNLDVYRWFVGERGRAFALAVIPLHLMHYLGNAVAAVGGGTLHLWTRIRRRRP